MRYRLRYLQHNLELSPGQFLIGRSTDCQLSVDDPLVSRRHARLLVTDEAVYVEDLGSRNGVLVDGVRIDGRYRLRDGSRVTVGAQEMTIVDAQRAPTGAPAGSMTHGDTSMRHPTLSLSQPPGPLGGNGAAAAAAQVDASADDPSRRVDALRLLGGVANKALALGRTEEAERILSTRLLRILEVTRKTPGEMPPEVVDQAARFAARLAGAMGKGSWVDFVVHLYAAQVRPFPAPLVDELYTVLRKVGSINLNALRAYVEDLQNRSGSFGPAERFLLQRIEGLERLASVK
ncbi:MAG TPA: FHA domain-containing protein [Polyangiaceae bacterium]|nr:FHA domain-containing protein [Polyangiaceae bacterium]